MLTAAREVLLNELLPLLPEERRLDARLVANCMAIAAREAETAEATGAVAEQLAALYRSPTDPAIREPDRGMAELWRRLACDLRIAAFENSPDAEARARAILWRLTIAKLRRANPRFLAANGLA